MNRISSPALLLLLLLNVGALGAASVPPAAPRSALAAAFSPGAPSERDRAFVGPVPQAVRASASYTLSTETFDAGGAAALASPSYTLKDASAGTVGALAGSIVYNSKGGYAGQLYEVQGLGVSAAAANVNEGGAIQLGAAPLLDDGTLLAALSSGVSWSVIGGPLASVTSGGLATAGIVYQNTPATVRATSGGLSGAGTLLVLNVNLDDFGAYAGDGIDDAWQVSYFGLNNPKAGPNVDADGTGQTNLFKYLAGLNPLDPSARFLLSISPVAGGPTQRALTLSPVYVGRTYTVQTASTLTQPHWTTLTNSAVSDDGAVRTVTDQNAGTALRFYRVQVSLP